MSAGQTPDELVASALRTTAALLAERFPSGSALRERQFEECFEQALQLDPSVRVASHRSLKLSHWREAYAIDTTATLQDGRRLVAELKWGVKTLYNCSWDLAKLAVVRAEAAADHAYLVAGAPASEWDAAAGAELFQTASWEPRTLRGEFGKHFDFWAQDVPTTGPIDLPAGFSSVAAAVASVPAWDGAWSLRAARVEVVDSAWIAWASLTN